MEIHGLQKMTLLDYPGKVACTVFLGGCNFRCPFCHNGELLDGTFPPLMDEAELIVFLKKRQGLLDGVCITGGEPLLRKELPKLLRQIKELGFAVKLDTNGTRPEALHGLMEDGLLDYVAMDIKNSRKRYGETVGVENFDISPVVESINILRKGKVPFEFRTTVVRELHSVLSIEGIGQLIKGAKRHYIQAFIDSGELIGFDLTAVPKDEMKTMRDVMLRYVSECEIRGI